MKIGILTYFSAHNYGAFLQAFALQKTLASLSNCEVELINYRSPKEIEFYSHVGILPPKSVYNFFPLFISRLKEKKYYKERFHCFEKAIREYQVTSEKSLITASIEEFNTTFESDYDLIVVGSDEIWKLDSFRGFPNAYWLPETKCQKVSYAASSRTHRSKLDSETAVAIDTYLSSYAYIGVRDSLTKTFIESFEHGKGKCHINCDPTFLYDFHTNPERGTQILLKKFRVRRGKKVIGLMLGEVALANDIVSTYGDMFEFVSLYHYCPNAKNCADINPFEWLDVISALDGVITTFFHACVFSMKSNIPFFAVDNRSDDISESKIFDLLTRNQIIEGRFAAYSEKRRGNILLEKIGPFLAEILNGSCVSFAEVCTKEKQYAESFFRYLNLPDRESVANVDTRDCCGCGLCASICPTKAIHIELNAEGFYRPVVDDKKCVHCGLCKKKCANNDTWGGLRTFQAPSAYGLKHRSEAIRMQSRSGGAFTLLSDFILEHGGTVYGSAMDDSVSVKHIRATTKEERDSMRGAKYVQSPMFHLFNDIRTDVQSGKPVLFSGTPCQTAAVKKCCEDLDCNQLYLVDILCHGVPSIAVYKDYLSYCQKQHNGTVDKFVFRNKQDYGWWEHVESFWIDGKRYDSREFTDLFYQHVIIDRSCSYCKFKSTDRVSDFTMGDFWGIENAITDFDDNKGVSLLLINSEKGGVIFDKVKDQAIVQEVPLEMCIQNSMKRPYPEPVRRNEFWDTYRREGLAYVLATAKRKKNIALLLRRFQHITKAVLKKLSTR